MRDIDRPSQPPQVPAAFRGDDQKTWAWLIYQFTLREWSLADVARNAGVERQTLYHVARHRYPRMEKIVADALGTTPAKIWPHRYCKDGLLPVGTMRMKMPRKNRKPPSLREAAGA